jgi:hypothetical protein
MKTKHNKKRNTAFLFEVLVKELTKSIISQSHSKSDSIKKILKEHFADDNVLGKELQCYKALSEKCSVDRYTAEKMIHRAKHAYDALGKERIFQEQSSVIKKINTELGSDIYGNFVPNYKSYATLSQIFGERSPLKKRVLMEQKILENLMENEPQEQDMRPVDTLVLTSFSQRFNAAYKDLLPEQKNLLSKYMLSYGDSFADFQVYLAEELQTIREAVAKSLTSKEVSEDQEMVGSTQKVLNKIDQFQISQINEGLLRDVLKLQQLAREYKTNAD